MSRFKSGGFRAIPNTDGSTVNPLELAAKDNLHHVSLQAPDTLASNVAYTLPGALGAPGVVLADPAGTGALAWIVGAAVDFAYGGDGSDGIVNLDGTNTYSGIVTHTGSAPNLVYTLARDVFATALTVAAGKTLIAANMRIFATATVTVNGTITNSGDAGGTLGGNQTGNASYLGWFLNPWAGVRMADGKPGAAGTTGAGANGANGNPAVAQAGSYVLFPQGTGFARPGAIGGNGGAASGGAGGTHGNGGTGFDGSQELLMPREAVICLYLRRAFGTTSYTTAVGDGGGGSGGAGAGDGAFAGGSGGASGGQGGGGGNLLIASPQILVGAAGVVASDGGAGGNGAAGGDGAAGTGSNAAGGGGGAGGAGGPGGIVALIFHAMTNSGAIHASGGAAGAAGAGGAGQGSGGSGTAGTNGNAGLAGVVIAIQT